MYKLTIAHGTYENFDKFKITFKSILSELKANKNVQLLILDDSVSDKTQNFIKKYNFKNLKYIKGKKESIDHAYIWMMANAQSEYVWWFGDDIMRKGSIKYILEVLKNNPDFVFVNSKADKKSLNFGKNFKLSGSEAIDKLGDLLLFLSSLLWKKSFIYPYLYKYKEKFGTAVGFHYPQVEALAQNGYFYYVDKPLFISEVNRDFDKLFYDPFKVFGKYYFELLDTFIEYQPLKTSLNKEKKRRGIQLIKGVLFYKLKGYDYGLGKTSLQDLIQTFWKWSFFWLWIPIIIFIYIIFPFSKRKFGIIFNHHNFR